MKVIQTISSASPDETRALANKIGNAIPAGAVIAATGDLGAGKTLFAAALGKALGITEPIVSPTFMFFREYEGRIPFSHIDAYRLEGLEEEEIALTGIDDALASHKAVLVEWPQFIEDRLPSDTIRMNIEKDMEEADKRIFTFEYDDETGRWLHEALGH